MDLSGLIFVALAVAWAVYLLPKALRHHDELASNRPVEKFSDQVRVLKARSGSRSIEVTVESREVEITGAAIERSKPLPTRAAARKAAQRRRRVLGVLTVVLLGVVGLAAFAVVPWWSTAAPAALIVAFLVIARLSVRSAAPARVARVVVPSESPAEEHLIEPDLAREDTSSISRAALDAALAREQANAAPLADEGSLWDPVPMTLPTYVNKPVAGRTVRSIELTEGITSSGHDAADTALARRAEADRQAQKAQQAQQDEDAKVAGRKPGDQVRKAAGA